MRTKFEAAREYFYGGCVDKRGMRVGNRLYNQPLVKLCGVLAVPPSDAVCIVGE